MTSWRRQGAVSVASLLLGSSPCNGQDPILLDSLSAPRITLRMVELDDRSIRLSWSFGGAGPFGVHRLEHPDDPADAVNLVARVKLSRQAVIVADADPGVQYYQVEDAPPCTGDAECEDGVACTADVCLGSGCHHDIIDDVCRESGCGRTVACCGEGEEARTGAELTLCRTPGQYCDLLTPCCAGVLCVHLCELGFGICGNR